jgi:heat shock protein HslJ
MKHLFFILASFILISCNGNSDKNKTKKDFINAIQGIWTVVEIKNITKETLANFKQTPTLKIEEENITGNNSCNNYFSSIKKISKKTIVFSNMGSSKIICPDMTISNAFNSLFYKIDTYNLKEKTLTFFNTKGEKVFALKKL